MIRALAREPLVHFGLLGALLFVLYARLAPAKPEPSALVVSSEQLASLAAQFERTRQRAPTTEELNGLVEGYVHDEILYREGLALGLDRDDAVVKNRVRQKLEILSDDALGEPTEAELETYRVAHGELFVLPAVVSFTQVYFDPERHGADLEAEIARSLAALGRDEPRAPAGADSAAAETSRNVRPPAGDFTTLPATLQNAAPAEVARIFGTAFESNLRALPVGRWSGPVTSAFGLHLVRVAARGEPRLPALSEIREQVSREYLHARTSEARARQYRTLRARYAVSVEGPRHLPTETP